MGIQTNMETMVVSTNELCVRQNFVPKRCTLPLTKLIVPQKYKDTTKKRGTEHQNHNLLMFRIRIQDRIGREEIKLHYS